MTAFLWKMEMQSGGDEVEKREGSVRRRGKVGT